MASRHEVAAQRQRGAGWRDISDDFNFNFSEQLAPAGTAAQQAKTPSGSSTHTRSRSSKGGGSLRPSAQNEITLVDENGSVVKKRKVTPARNGISTPVQPQVAAGDATGASAVVPSSQKSSAKRRRGKRTSISQSSDARKRSLAKTRPSTSTIESPEPISGIHDQADDGRTLKLKPVHEPETDTERPAADIAADEGEVALDEAHEMGDAPVDEQVNAHDSEVQQEPVTRFWQRKPSARKSADGPVQRLQPSVLPEPRAVLDTEEAQSEPENDDPGLTQEDEDDSTAAEDQVVEPTEEAPTAIMRPVTKAKKRKKRKSVNPIAQERRKRASLEAARQNLEGSESVQRSSRPAGRKLAVQRPPPATKAGSQISRAGHDKPGQVKQIVQSRPAPSKPRRTGTADSDSSQQTVKAKPGSVAINVYRIQHGSGLAPILEEDEEEAEKPLVPHAPPPKGPNAIDSLASICADLINNQLEAAEKAEEQASGRSEKAAAKRQRNAIEAFKVGLEARMLEMTQALDHHNATQLRLRQAKKIRKTLRNELSANRREAETLTRDLFQLRSRRDLAVKVAEDDGKIMTLRRKLMTSMRDASNASKEDDDTTSVGLEYELRIAEAYTTADGRQGLLGKIKAFNTRLEGIIADT